MPLHIDILAVGKLKEHFWVQACAEYQKRLGRYVKLQVIELGDLAARSDADIAAVLSGEAQAVMRALASGSHVVALDSSGEQMSSERFAQSFERVQNLGCSHISFLIGGSYGLHAELKRKADAILSLGKMTLPHNLARVVLLEQIYRALRIINAEPYHK